MEGECHKYEAMPLFFKIGYDYNEYDTLHIGCRIGGLRPYCVKEK